MTLSHIYFQLVWYCIVVENWNRFDNVCPEINESQNNSEIKNFQSFKIKHIIKRWIFFDRIREIEQIIKHIDKYVAVSKCFKSV